MPFFTPFGLKIRLDFDYAFSLINKIRQNVPDKAIRDLYFQYQPHDKAYDENGPFAFLMKTEAIASLRDFMATILCVSAVSIFYFDIFAIPIGLKWTPLSRQKREKNKVETDVVL